MTEKCFLKWTDFQNNLATNLGQFRADTDFTDVTLACEDGHIEAHKVILSASSPFFQNILRKNKHPHPLIYMTGMRSEDLTAIVDFLYFGETNIDKSNLDMFLEIGKELKLKGLTDHSDEQKHNIIKQSMNIKETDEYENLANVDCSSLDAKVESDVLEKLPSDKSYTSPETPNDFSGETLSLDEKITSLIVKGQKLVTSGGKQRRAHICTVCGKEAKWNIIRDHIEANHLEGVTIPCSFCDQVFR